MKPDHNKGWASGILAVMTDPDVLFVVLDSLRTDRVSGYGHDRPTTPALDALAADATTFDRAYTPAPWTLPSHCSVFTGLHPSEHGVTNGFADRRPSLPETVDTLAELLRERGYRTAGFSNNPWVGALSGLDRGFDEFVEWDLEIGRSNPAGPSLHGRIDRLYSRGHAVMGRAASQPLVLLKRRFFTRRLADRAVRWLRADDDRPTFTFLNLMEAHSPYYPPRSAFRGLDLDPPGPLESRRRNLELLAYVMGRTDLSAADRDRMLAFYDASVRYQDGVLGDLLGALDATGAFDDTLVVVCADHGKTLGEYDRDAVPPHYLREVNTNVPLVVKWPGQRQGERVGSPVELHRLFDVVTDPAAGPDALAPPDGWALVEDFVPHTGREAASTTRWQLVTDGSDAVVRADDDRAFVLEGRRLDQQVVDAETDRRTRLLDRLDDRVSALSPVDPVPAAAEGRPASGNAAGRTDHARRSATAGQAADGAAHDGDAGDSDEDEQEEEGLGRGVERQLEDLGYL